MSSRMLTVTMVVLLSACAADQPKVAPPPAAPTGQAQPWEPHVLRTYAVPPGHEQDLKSLLGSSSYPISVISAAGTQTQFVHLNPQFTGAGYFVLSAPVGIHDGVKGLIELLAKAPAPAPKSTIEVSYWLVLGYPSAEARVSDQLADAADAVKALGNLGPMQFEPLEKLTLATLDGEEGRATGRLASIKQVASMAGGVVQLNVELAVEGGGARASVQTALDLKPGQFAVLARAGYTPIPGELTNGPKGEPTLFYLVRVRVQD